jgi:hypothetical protein
MDEEEIYQESSSHIPLAPQGPGHELNENFENLNLYETNITENTQTPIKVKLIDSITH